jgi:hypothetical protein
MTTTLRDRAAAALDATSNPALALSSELYTIRIRSYVATWLDGKAKRSIKTASVRRWCAYLEMVAR